MLKILLIAGGFFLSSVRIHPDETLQFDFDGHYTVLERQDIRQRENGRYRGFIYREMRGVLKALDSCETGRQYSGSFFLYRKMTRNTLHIAKVIDEVVPASFVLNSSGRMQTSAEASVPPVQNFPVLPNVSLREGDTWRDYGIRVVDPKGGRPTRVKILSEYVYKGVETGQGRERHHIRAQFALRYHRGQDPYGDDDVVEISGKHLVDIYITQDAESSVFMRDTMEDRYRYADGSTIEESGIILTWFDDIAGMDRPAVKRRIQEIAEETPDDDITVTERPEGIVLQIQNIHFYPDEDRLLPGQEGKIERIARILLQNEGHTFLVSGHTADVGSQESQQLLSQQRAQVITRMLIERGIPADKLIYQGRGGREPIAPNDTEENMAKNRRVEITILEGTR